MKHVTCAWPARSAQVAAMSEGLPHVERELPEIAGGGATCLSLSPAPLPPTGPQPHTAVSQPCSLRARYLPHSRYEKQGPGNRGWACPALCPQLVQPSRPCRQAVPRLFHSLHSMQKSLASSRGTAAGVGVMNTDGQRGWDGDLGLAAAWVATNPGPAPLRGERLL